MSRSQLEVRFSPWTWATQRISTTKQDLERQIDALEKAGIPAERVYVDKKTGKTRDRPGLTALFEYAREGDVIVVHTLDRLGRTLRDTLNMIHELSERKVGIKSLADPIKVDTTVHGDLMAELAIALLALFAQMERTYTLERAAHARAVAMAKGRRVGRPSVVDSSNRSMPFCCETPVTPWPRSPPRQVSSVSASIATSRPDERQPSRSPQLKRPPRKRKGRRCGRGLVRSASSIAMN